MMWFRKKWNFLKRVSLFSVKDKQTNEIVEWCEVVLLEETKTKERKFERIADWPSSPAAKKQRAKIIAWKHGGPEPEGMVWSGYTSPPKPRKPIPGKTRPLKPAKQKQENSENVLQFPDKKTA